MAEYQNLKYGVQDQVAVIAIDHPPANAFNTATMADLEAAFDAATADPSVKVILITGAGQFAFVAGADINEIKELREDPAAAEVFIRKGQAVFRKIEASRKPVIAAINAVALGGGLELALACHIRIASDRARLGLAEANLGLIPGWGGTQRLPRAVGRAKATEMILTGDMINAQEAYRIGLVNKVVPATAVIKEAMGLARKLTQKSAVAMSAALAAIDAGYRLSPEAGYAAEIEQFATVGASQDAGEGIAAFLEKRKPRFSDQ